MKKILGLSLAAAASLIGWSYSQAQYVWRPPVDPASQGANASGAPRKFERIPDGENEQIARIVQLTDELLNYRYGDNLARRGVHAKAHGCVLADFTVNADIPENLRVGVLAKPGATYKAWIRFSNATGLPTRDLTEKGATSRGMAIKLMGVEGDTLLRELGAKSQDFLLINQKMFAFPNVEEYLAVTQLQFENRSNGEDISKYFAQPLSPARARTAGIAKEIAMTPLANPLDAAYFSAAPFLLGKDKVVKFSAKPRNPAVPPSNPPSPSADYLREALQASMNQAGDPVLFDFRVQMRPDGLQPNDPAFPIEDASAKWEDDEKAEKHAKFENVAVIAIPRPQDVNDPLRVTECEHLALTPWHGLVQHQPLGGINRLRRAVYIASSTHRAQAAEPSKPPKEYPLKKP